MTYNVQQSYATGRPVSYNGFNRWNGQPIPTNHSLVVANPYGELEFWQTDGTPEAMMQLFSYYAMEHPECQPARLRFQTFAPAANL